MGENNPELDTTFNSNCIEQDSSFGAVEVPVGLTNLSNDTGE